MVVVIGVPALRVVQGARAGPRRAWSKMRAGAWPIALSMVVIALGNAAILMSPFDWPWMRLAAGVGAEGLSFEMAGLVLFICLLAGAIVGGISARGFNLEGVSVAQCSRCTAGGMVMGFAVRMVPGGNDTLVLQSLPFLWAHALSAYALMCAGVAIALIAGKAATNWRASG